jgi:hypothetical protein
MIPEARKVRLKPKIHKVLEACCRAPLGLRFNERLDEEDGPLVFAYACKLELISTKLAAVSVNVRRRKITCAAA